MNDTERRQWVENHHGLYLWWKRSGVGLYRFVKENRYELTQRIEGILHHHPGPWPRHDTTWATGYGEVRR